MFATEYQQRKTDLLNTQNPYKIINKGDIQFVEETIYKLDGQEFQIAPSIAAQIDQFIGLHKQQVRAIHASIGEDGVRDYRNYIAMVNSITNPEKLALIADPHQRKIIGVTALKEEAIPLSSFFDFAEIFANDNNYTIKNIVTSSDTTVGLEMTMIPDSPKIISLGQDEDFMTNGLILRWNLGTIELHHYYERLVCANGSIETTLGKHSSFYALNDKTIKQLLSFPQRHLFDFNKFSNHAYAAMETKASIAELHRASNLLLSNGLDNDLMDAIIPYQADVQAYERMGYRNLDYSRAKSSLLVWDVFNRLTFFASHNEIWTDDDNRRNLLMHASVQFLQRQRDIKEYYDIFN